MSFILWLKIGVKLRVKLGETLSSSSPLLVRMSRGQLVPMTGVYMARMDQYYAPALSFRSGGWYTFGGRALRRAV